MPLQPLLNRDVAHGCLEAAEVSALVLSDPTNIYQATGFWPQTVAMGQAGAAFAIVPADTHACVTLITSQFIHYLHDVEAPVEGGALDIRLFTAPDGLEGDAAPPIFLSAPPGGRPDTLDALSQETTRATLQRHRPYPDAASALRDVLAGTHGTIATDSPMIDAILGERLAYRPAAPFLRRIRMIKSPREIELMRHAAQNNADAARAAIQQMGAGSTYEDMRLAFFAETGKRGGIPLFISTDSMTMRKRDGVLREGRSFQIDAVSHYAGYHGDYGRTVFVGEPDPVVMHMVEAAQCANDAIAQALKPGLRYSDVRRIGQEAVARAGYEIAIPCAAHSVGLFHTDEAYADDSLHFRKDDHLIEANMVLSVDCPVLHLDATGNVHLEDLWLVTEDGCEPLNRRDEPFIRI
ncbi:M24 family metallopeptidase [Novosphingobium sp. MBES04]|uniref:M24 family metallopeptidase n=1 Tax=Novosphingobium sp. MBES04 TaxID=1206458 RepID=UPI00057DFC98|nr:M24 family metallopeptidase [Novosphingobium sp. MBES04]GAM04356.1 peptidase M24 [Novosphingobium sp. MBES04]